MVDSIPKFDAIKFQAQQGENCIATKKEGVVTIKGDKNGVRQMPFDDFMKEFVKNQSKQKMERSPEKDSVNFTSKYNDLSSKRTRKLVFGAIALTTLAVGLYKLSKYASSLLDTIVDSSADITKNCVDDIANKMKEGNHKVQSTVKDAADNVAQSVKFATEKLEEKIPKIDKSEKAVVNDVMSAGQKSANVELKANKGTEKTSSDKSNERKVELGMPIEEHVASVRFPEVANTPLNEVTPEARAMQDAAFILFQDVFGKHSVNVAESHINKLGDIPSAINHKTPVVSEIPKPEIKTEIPSGKPEIKNETKASKFKETSDVSSDEELIASRTFGEDAEKTIEDANESKISYEKSDESFDNKNLSDDIEENIENKTVKDENEESFNRVDEDDVEDSFSSYNDEVDDTFETRNSFEEEDTFGTTSSFDEPDDTFGSSMIDDTDSFDDMF
jgi:hypothetical protein